MYRPPKKLKQFTKKNKKNKNNKSIKNNNKLAKKPSFATKLGAFMLQGVKDEIHFDKEKGFSNIHIGVYGVLPYLHMNITENDFKKLMEDSAKNDKAYSRILSDKCNSKKLDKKLEKVKFQCEKQLHSSIMALNLSVIDSINDRYKIRKQGQKNLKKILGFMNWQVKNNIIPVSSLEWSK
tara:strand:+ start:138 stop:677 length:540 start_codon:yes stop_codon:yes gene_type:complete